MRVEFQGRIPHRREPSIKALAQHACGSVHQLNVTGTTAPRCAQVAPRRANKHTERLVVSLVRRGQHTRAWVESFCHTKRDDVGDCEDHAYQLVVAATKFQELDLSPGSELRVLQDYACRFHFGVALGTVECTNTQAHAFNLAIDRRYFFACRTDLT